MKEPSKKIIYNVKGLSTEQYDELINYIQKYSDENKKGMDYLCAKEQRLEYKKNHYLHYNECAEVFAYLTKEQIKGSKPTANAKELFYTLENIQVDCSKLSEAQIDKMIYVFESNKYKVWDDMRALDIEYGDFLMVGLDNEVYLNNGFKSKHTITYEKFMELFSNKEENFKKLVEVLNEELTEKAYEVSYIAEKPKQYQIGIDTFTRCEANMTKEEILACCKFNIDKYNWRNKGQDLEDLEKIISYANWAIKQLKK